MLSQKEKFSKANIDSNKVGFMGDKMSDSVFKFTRVTPVLVQNWLWVKTEE